MSRTYTIQDFKIVSTACDPLLFFSSDYQRAVTEAINDLMDDIGWTAGMKLIPDCRCIVVEAPGGTRHIEPLRQYNETQDMNEYTF